MRRNSILLDLLDKRDWAQFQPLVDRFQGWAFYPLFLQAVEELNLGVLYESDIHGIGHIERTLCHGAMCAMDEALRCRETGEAKTILFGLTGTGYFDMTAYQAYLAGAMSDYIPTDEDLQKGFDSLPDIPQNQDI